MTPGHKRLVKNTWKQVTPIADTAADIFYRRLFEIDPSTRKLFRATDMVAQRKKLLQTLSFAISGLDDLAALVSKVEDLGRRHVGYGVTNAHYDSVGAALLWTLEQGLGQAWTPEVASAWTEVYGFLSGIMRKAAAQADIAAVKHVAVPSPAREAALG
jgi:hemoglobin-like flavoprotein